MSLPVVSIMGHRASFHDIAAGRYFDAEVEVLENPDFDSMLSRVVRGEADYGVMAVENSLTGTILPNLPRLHDSGLRIAGEVVLRVRLNLCALPGRAIADLDTVFSHPMAMLESKKFFADYPRIHLVAQTDTAAAAGRIRREELDGAGAIASLKAARLFDLEVLAEGIEDNARNFTRFLILTREPGEGPAEKAAVAFRIPRGGGDLARFLARLAGFGANPERIHTLPAGDPEGSYMVHVDLDLDDERAFREGLEAAGPVFGDIRLLGVYAAARTYEEAQPV